MGAACEEETHAAASRRGSHSARTEGCSGGSSCSGGEFKGGHCEREDATSSCCRDQKADEGVCVDIVFLEMSDAVAVPKPLLTRRRARLQTPAAAEEAADAVQESESEGAAGAAAAGETTKTTTASKAKKKQARSEK